MGRKQWEQQLAAQQAQISAMIAQMQNPASNPAQQYLTNEALAGADYLKKGEYSSLPKGMFFNFEMPQKQLEQYKKLTNVNQGGTFALANAGAGGRSRAMGQQSKYLGDKFARDTLLNYQNNISGARGEIGKGLYAAAGAKSGQDSQIMGALQNLYSTTSHTPQKAGFNWGAVIGGALGAI